MNIFDKVGHVFSKIVQGVEHLFSPAVIDEAERIAKRVTTLTATVLPYAQQLAAGTANQWDDHLVKAAAEMGTTVDAIIALPDRDAKKNAIEALLAKAGHFALSELLGGHGELRIGDLKIADQNGLSAFATQSLGLFEMAAKAAYQLFIKASRTVEAPPRQ